MKRIILAAAGAAVVGLAACGHSASPTAAPTSHASVRVPVSCGQQYNTWRHGSGDGLLATLGAVSSAETAGDTQVLTATLNRTRSAVSWAAHHPVPACADPRGYWDVLLMHVTAAAANTRSASSMRAAMKNVPEVEHQLTAELKQTTAQ